MICALCKIDRELVDSHVIPEFAFKPLYDEKHRFEILSQYGKKAIQCVQKCEREKLLCKVCECKFSRLEKYASEVFSGNIKANWERISKDVFRISGLDYKRFKLFILSVLWRASVSKQDMFVQVDLGRHEDNLRQMLYNEDPGPSQKYGFISILLLEDDNDPKEIVFSPIKHRLKSGHICYRFVFGGHIWLFIVSSQAPPEIYTKSFIKENGSMIVGVKSLSDAKFIQAGIANIFEKRYKELFGKLTDA